MNSKVGVNNMNMGLLGLAFPMLAHLGGMGMMGSVLKHSGYDLEKAVTAPPWLRRYGDRVGKAFDAGFQNYGGSNYGDSVYQGLTSNINDFNQFQQPVNQPQQPGYPIPNQVSFNRNMNY